ncbi:MAG: DUF1343 domain-containing protein [Armatimonadaceae bacterium]
MARVKTGLEVWWEKSFAPLAGLNVGLITNHTGILPDRSANMDALKAASNVRLKALFGPEHGVRGDIWAGETVESYTDKKTGLPVYSLYGRTRVPTATMLRGLDVLVFDIQDIGSRSYTYLSTMGSAMEGAAQHGVPFIVLDRPNPVGLNRIEGGPTRPGFESFIGKYPVSYLHGMTLGELAKMINGAGWLPGGRQCDLTVVPCENLTRKMAVWEAFGGLPWIRTSPNVPYDHSPHFYAATGIFGELPVLSIGIGTDVQFEVAGAPWLSSRAFAEELNRRGVGGIRFDPATWTPNKGAHRGKRCNGVRIRLTNPETAELTRVNFELMDALRAIAPKREVFAARGSTRMFDLACGTDRIRKAFLAGADGNDLWRQFNEGQPTFATARKTSLLYS